MRGCMRSAFMPQVAICEVGANCPNDEQNQGNDNSSNATTESSEMLRQKGEIYISDAVQIVYS